MKANDIKSLINDNSYVGRGIIIGKTPDGKKAVSAYFIMGRSANSRNRIFVEKDGALCTEPYDIDRVEDPSLIIYTAVKWYKNNMIITNGDHTETVYEGLKYDRDLKTALSDREFESDTPNFTPRISGVLCFDKGDFSYEMSILKSADEMGTACNRYTYSYTPTLGIGHFIHTYECDGNPLPSFCGEPKRVLMENDIDCFADKLWTALSEENKISLFVCYTDLESGENKKIIINKNQ